MKELLSLLATACWCLAATGLDFFESKVRPVLAANCLECHGKSGMGGLRLDSRERMLEGGKSGPAVVPGNAAASILLRAISHSDPKLKMPPKGKLSDADAASLRAWIDAGAVWPDSARGTPAKSFWSFQPVRKAAVPAAGTGWARTAPDRFLAEKLQAAGMKPAREADRQTWIRRVTFDLTGLPPTPEEVDAFAADTTPGARERTVDRLLSSPHYGERWARYWLDLARYSDGQQAAREDTPYANAFRYRDWVVDAFNSDLPYDTFVKAQIAADLMPEPKRLLAGLGFQALGENDDDRLDVTTRVFLGLTVGCARCHDHKYDPIPARDYYSLLGVFRSSKSSEHPLVPASRVEAYKKAKLASDEKKAQIKRFTDQQIALAVDMLSAQTDRYIVSAWRLIVDPSQKLREVASRTGLDAPTLDRWVKYLQRRPADHHGMDRWHDLVERSGGAAKAGEADVLAAAAAIHGDVQALLTEKKAIDDRNYVKVGGIEGMMDANRVIKTLVESMPVERYYF
jgi:cytochrome c553